MITLFKNELKSMVKPVLLTFLPFALFALFAFFSEAASSPSITATEACLAVYTGSATDMTVSGASNTSMPTNRFYYIGLEEHACAYYGDYRISGNYSSGSILTFNSGQYSYFPQTWEFQNGEWVKQASSTASTHIPMDTAQVLQYYGILAAFILAFTASFKFYKSFVLRRNA